MLHPQFGDQNDVKLNSKTDCDSDCSCNIVHQSLPISRFEIKLMD